jgi:hypothetical protein
MNIDFFELFQSKITPFSFQSDDVAEERKIISFLLAFGNKPRPVSGGKEIFYKNFRIFNFFLFISLLSGIEIALTFNRLNIGSKNTFQKNLQNFCQGMLKIIG